MHRNWIENNMYDTKVITITFSFTNYKMSLSKYIAVSNRYKYRPYSYTIAYNTVEPLTSDFRNKKRLNN